MQDNNDLLTVTFRLHSIHNETRSKEKGRPIYDDMEVCDIKFAGDSKKAATFPAHEAEPNASRKKGVPVTYAEVYNAQYRAFKDGIADVTSGTPIAELPFLTEGKRSELRALSINTAEALAALDGQPLARLGMGGRDLKNKAMAFLQKANGSADLTRLAADNDALQRVVQDMQSQIIELQGAAKARAEAQPVESDENLYPNFVDPNAPDFDAMEDGDLKEFIAKQTGKRPQGNPSHNTLVNAARELAAA